MNSPQRDRAPAATFFRNITLVLCIIGFAARPCVAADARDAFNFNSGWKLFVGDADKASEPGFDDSQWKSVTLPHAFNEDDAFKKDIRELTTSIAWYRKTFRLPAGSEGKKCFIEFQGVRHGADVFLNGKPVGIHENGVMAFGIDLTNELLPPGQDNVIAVKTDNSWSYKERATGSNYQWADRNFYANYGGINKNVILHLTDTVYQTLPLFSNLGTTGVYVYPSEIDVAKRSATINVESEVKNERSTPANVSYSVKVDDADGKTIATFTSPAQSIAPGATATLSAKGTANNLNFWSWGYGYLYNVSTTLSIDGAPIDTVRTKTGFRKTEFGNGVLKLNDRTIHLKGYAQRTTNEWPALGINLPPWVSDLSNGMMVQSNGNLVRWMHVTPSKQDVESCDRVGLIQAMPAGDSEADRDGRRWELRVLLMRDAIIYNRNNPSIIFYEAGNKGISEPHMIEMVDLRKKYDPQGGRAMGSREMLGSNTAEWGGEMLYINKSAGKPLWATEYSRDEGPRKFMDELTPPYHKNGDGPLYRDEPAPSYNHNQDSHALENIERWYDYWRERPGTGNRVNGGAVNIIFSDSNTHHRGSQNYRTSGEVDPMRLTKEGYFVHQVMWDGWTEVERPAAHIIGHWNYKDGVTKPVYVVSSADKVELFLNNKSLGVGKQSNRFQYTFDNVKWQPGTLRAVGYDAKGTEVCHAQIHTTGDPVSIKLTPRVGRTGLHADGSDLALVDVEVVDARGDRVPVAMNEIDFDLTGPAEWRGGIAQGPDNYILSKKLPVELGINRVIVRSTPQAGTIKLTATAKGLKPASIELKSKPVEVANGLSRNFPDDGIVGTLERGPTPKGDSVKPTRTTLKVVKALAGADSDNVSAAIDDDETTSWANDGKVQTAWIRFELNKPSTVSEVCLKMHNWRSRSYPIRILVDKEVVFTGSTPRSLGYVTLPLKPTQGSVVTIQMTGEGAPDADNFDNIVEVTGQKLSEGGGANEVNARNAFRIVEAEIYGPVH